MQQVQQIQVSGHKYIHHDCSQSLSLSRNGVQGPSTICLVPPCPVTQSVRLRAAVPEPFLTPEGRTGAVNHLLLKQPYTT